MAIGSSKSFIDNPGKNGIAAVTSTSSVTASNPTAATDTQLIELSLPTGFLNFLGQAFLIRGGGVFSTTAASSPQITITAKLCTVSGCGSGTVVSLGAIQSSAASATAATNNTWTYSLTAVTSTVGSSGNLVAKSDPGLVIDLSNVVSAADTIFTETNSGNTGNIDLTAALFLDFTVAQSTTGASNSYKQLFGMIAPQSNPIQITGGTTTVASGTAALGTASIATVACASAVTVAAAAVLTTDTIIVSFNQDVTGTTGYQPSTGVLTIYPYPTAGNVNFKVCNLTANAITPSAVTLNWRVVR